MLQRLQNPSGSAGLGNGGRARSVSLSRARDLGATVKWQDAGRHELTAVINSFHICLVVEIVEIMSAGHCDLRPFGYSAID
ncbi:hypothetical protein VitviT2T_000481 [Vitis vinifera]|uniref:Uncharacterized protein n=1 Tax=Vitis vinifera TaxID=29760 RepID=A0ABY9BDA1_VITVI|nr:hypothetical protein VitviT2T_000481 [Vitis vinifera]